MNKFTKEALKWLIVGLDANYGRFLSKKIVLMQPPLKLVSCMGNIEAILSQGGTAPLDFTLHDADHSFRVAQRMIEIIPEPVLDALSEYELALLLLSAYLHDIGMSPERRKVTNHYKYLLTGDQDLLTASERQEFQTWLGEVEEQSISPPLTKGIPTHQEINLATRLITYYCRHKHNDWSKDWINQAMGKYSPGQYFTWKEDLIDLCQSHHWGYEQLISPGFDPRLLHSGRIVHLRYLACVLRVADILENDPERTPDVIFHHRDISPGSQIFWWKDHNFVLSINHKTRQLSVRGRPKNAVIHRAILDTASAIEQELRLCRRIAANHPFQILPEHPELPHYWDLEDSIYTDIRPYKDTYTYIEGAFRPNTQKLLKLLGGLELYGDKLSAVRELIQNAFDAVREQVAYERLRLPDHQNPSDPAWVEKLGKNHLVELSVERDQKDRNQWWLICKDDGIGMTKAIIENHLLVSGSATRKDIRMLESRCREKGFSTERTGKFGIGVLSYFMLADRVEVITRRSQDAGDADGEAWSFTSDGVGSFGELRRYPGGPRGTELRLRLREKLYILDRYIQDSLIYLPCKFVVQNNILPDRNLEFEPGWVRNTESWRESIIESPVIDVIKKNGGEFAAQIAQEASDRLDWIIDEGSMPDGLGRYRIAIPYFKLNGGLCFAFMRTCREGNLLKIEQVHNTDIFLPNQAEKISYAGIAIKSGRSSDKILEGKKIGSIVEIDWITEQAGQISVNRTEFTESIQANEARSFLKNQLDETLSRFLRQQSSDFHLLNCRLADLEPEGISDCRWLSTQWGAPFGDGFWRKIEFPATSTNTFIFSMPILDTDFRTLINHLGNEDNNEDLEAIFFRKLTQYEHPATWRGQELHLIKALSPKGLMPDTADAVLWRIDQFPPDFISIVQDPTLFAVVPIWSSASIQKSPSSKFVGCHFPPNWDDLLGISWGKNYLLNSSHPAFRMLLDADSLEKMPYKSFNYKGHEEDILQSREISCMFIFNLLIEMKLNRNEWNPIIEKHPDFVKRLWWNFFNDQQQRDTTLQRNILLRLEDDFPGNGFMLVASIAGVKKLTQKKEIVKYLPSPDEEWEITLPNRTRC